MHSWYSATENRKGQTFRKDGTQSYGARMKVGQPGRQYFDFAWTMKGERNDGKQDETNDGNAACSLHAFRHDECKRFF